MCRKESRANIVSKETPTFCPEIIIFSLFFLVFFFYTFFGLKLFTFLACKVGNSVNISLYKYKSNIKHWLKTNNTTEQIISTVIAKKTKKPQEVKDNHLNFELLSCDCKDLYKNTKAL
ncbi:hypothetical protein EGW08_023539 [Elysia chlorotica]|uniref:Uncharacterized protein n=1 Tax=Elysia chlorotica TaxID=188477 RepID=A0A3S1GYH9_ELYCH|nr:hypothetical protein EGW08_023539 [Elysia chlorotica]